MGAAQGDSAGREGGDAQQVMHGQTSRGKVRAIQGCGDEGMVGR